MPTTSRNSKNKKAENKVIRVIVGTPLRPAEYTSLEKLASKSGVCPAVLMRGFMRKEMAYTDFKDGEILEIIRLGKF